MLSDFCLSARSLTMKDFPTKTGRVSVRWRIYVWRRLTPRRCQRGLRRQVGLWLRWLSYYFGVAELGPFGQRCMSWSPGVQATCSDRCPFGRPQNQSPLSSAAPQAGRRTLSAHMQPHGCRTKRVGRTGVWGFRLVLVIFTSGVIAVAHPPRWNA
jgi:hypothetical protein